MGERARSWLVCGLALVGVTLAPLPYLDLAGPLPVLQAGLPVVGLLGVPVVAALAWRRQWRTALVSAAAAGLLIGPIVAPVSRLEPPGATVTRSTPLRVMSLNAEFGQAEPAAVLEQVRARKIDVLVLVEMTPAFWTRLRDAGLAEVLPYATGTTSRTASGSVIAAAAPFTCPQPQGSDGSGPCGQVVPDQSPHSDPDFSTGPGASMPVVRLADGTLLRAVHPLAPHPVDGSLWRAEQAGLQRWKERQPAGTPLIIAGDFNSGRAHPAYRKLADGMAQAPLTGFPWPRTWPQEMALPPFVGIDHILSRGFAVTQEAVFTVPGTDHAAVSATLQPVAAR